MFIYYSVSLQELQLGRFTEGIAWIVEIFSKRMNFSGFENSFSVRLMSYFIVFFARKV